MNAHSVTFDKLVYLDRLKAAGVADDVARAHAEGLDQALRESVATKSDLEKVETALRSDLGKAETALRTHVDKVEVALRSDLGKVETALHTHVEKVEAALRGQIEKLDLRLVNSEAKLDGKIDITAATLRAEIEASKNSSLRWIFGFNLALVGAVFAIIKYFH